MQRISIVIPAKNEASNLNKLLKQLIELSIDRNNIIVVNDGSTDSTEEIAKSYNINVITHKYSMGNGAAIKTGARHSNTEYTIFMDGDGQHKPKDIVRLLNKIEEGYDMVVGARDRESQASAARSLGNRVYNWLASWVTGHDVKDLTSGFRIVNTRKFKQFLYLLPNGFSYPTTITMAFFRAGFSVNYLPIKAEKRLGKSHINLFKDGVRFLLIIFKVGTLFSPLKIFFPIALTNFLMGLSYYLYTYFVLDRFTNMGAFLFMLSSLIFVIGLVSEQITALMYKDHDG